MPKRIACRAVTRTGVPCSRPALKSSSYCWWHDDRHGADRRFLGVLLPIVTLVLTLFGVWWTYRSWRDTQIREHFSRKRDLPMLDQGYSVFVGEGGFHLWNVCGTEAIRLGDSFRLSFDSVCRPLLHGDIRDRNGTIIGELKGNTVDAPPNLGYDINSDKLGYELVDPRCLPIMQLDVDQRAKRIVVNFFTYATRADDPGGPLMSVCDRDGCAHGISEKEGIARQRRAGRLFEYSGFKNPGRRHHVVAAVLPSGLTANSRLKPPAGGRLAAD
jgi:hypothetical protein